MLPGFRFLFAAIMLSLSILIFGLGAAALLRAAHEEVAINPSWRATPETTFAQQPEATRREATRPDAARPVLAMLRVDAPIVEKSSDVPAAAAPLAPAEPAEQAAPLSTPAEPEGIAALKPEDSSLPEPAKPEIPVSESPAENEAAPALANAPAPADEIRIASATTEAVPPANEAARAASGQTSAAASPDPDLASILASIKIAILNGPPVTIEAHSPRKAAGAKPDTGAIQKRLQARRAAQRRRMAARARLARQALLQQQQIPNPFAPPAIQPAIQPTVQPTVQPSAR
jgi:hypothetical protein